MPNHRFSPRVEALAARLGSTVPYVEAGAILALAVDVRVSATTLRRQTYAAGEAALTVEDAALQVALTTPAVHPAPPAPLQLSIDATKVPLLHGAWTDVKLAVVAELVPGLADDTGHPTHTPRHHSYVARWEPAERFGQTLTLEAQQRGLDEAGAVVSPNDGADWIQGVVDLLAPRAVRILDFPHAVEHLGTVAALVTDTAPAAGAWVAAQRTALAQQGAGALLATLAACQAHGPSAAARPDADGKSPAEQLAREVAYFTKRAAQLAYPAFHAVGYPLGSGLVESGHKVVIGSRFKGAGHHWASHHLNPLLVLRCASCNERWPATWATAWGEQCAQAQRTRRVAQQQRRTARLTLLPALPPAALPPPPSPMAPAPTPPPPRPKLVIDGRPTAAHPWRSSPRGNTRRRVG